VLSCQNLDNKKKSASTEKGSSQNNTPNVALFSQKLRDFAYICDSVTNFGQGVKQASLG